MLWLGESRGYLSDYVTQLWVRSTGREVDLSEAPWLRGPVGFSRGIGSDFFHELARAEGLKVQQGKGLMPDFSVLSGPGFDLNRVSSGVRRFYENTSCYSLDAWSEWCGFHKPFGRLLAILFSRRLQQLNIPLSSLDTSRGITSEVLDLVNTEYGERQYTVWLRHLVSSRDVLYAGSYSSCIVPGFKGACIKVTFPLPNGNAIVIMYPESSSDGSVTITSAGRSFGDPGFYFTVHHGSKVWARYVRSMQESIRVYQVNEAEVRADHVLRYFGAVFLRLHYKLAQTSEQAQPAVLKS
jgi:hypothetical protein